MTQVPEPESQPASSWRESAVEFVSARVELLSLETREASQQAARKGALAAWIAGCAVIAWMAAVAGLIGWVASSKAGIPWYFVAFGAAMLHLLLAGIAVLALRRPGPPAFPLSKAELLKDREWLINLKDPKH